MTTYRYRLLNVFAIAGSRLSGNPLCAFEDGRGLDDATMQALALQFNLSETTFILPSDKATARVRIFTPAFELPFAGHPTLGTAHVVRALHGQAGPVTLETNAGVIPVTAEQNRWTLQANKPTWRPVEANREQLGQMLSLPPDEVGERPLWVNTGSEQLVIPLTSSDAVAHATPVAELLAQHGRLTTTRHMAYVWAPAEHGEIHARFFFGKGAAVIEDPATGSACANLGGWFVATDARLPLTQRIRQGDAIRRPSLLGLSIDAQKRIFVSGEVIELGQGAIEL